MAFYVELPADEYGNRSFPPCVIEADLSDGLLVVKAPPEFVSKWSLINGRRWIEVSGPARIISWEELDELVKTWGNEGAKVG